MILVILGNKAIRDQVSLSLEDAGYSVKAVTNSTEAVEYLRGHQVEHIITEVNIGDIDGWRLTRMIRSGVFLSEREIPVLLVTESYCERIAEATARMFGINKVVSYQDVAVIPSLLAKFAYDKKSLTSHKKVLVIEDTEDTAQLVSRILKNRFQVDLAEDGIKGLERYNSKEYDIVLLDIMMPRMSGEEVLEKIMSINPEQVVIAMTAHGTADLAELLLTRGASDYIMKPFKADQMRQVCEIASMREDFLVSAQQFAANSAALEHEQQKYDSLSKNHHRVLGSLNSIVIEISVSGRISFLNNAWSTITGFSVSKSIGQTFASFMHDCDLEQKQVVNKCLKSLLNQQSMTESIEVKVRRSDSTFFWAKINLAVHLGDDKKVAGISGTIDDIEERKFAEEKLRYLALHDGLTGLFNRHHFDEELKNIAQTDATEGNTHALLYIDLDHFKVINDSHGHSKGDLVLKEIANLLKERIRDKDTLCRIGGDEFAILLVDLSIKKAEEIASAICADIADTAFQIEDHTYRVSSSIGIAQICRSGGSKEILLQQADIAMLSAKKRGRNRAYLFNDSDEDVETFKYSFEWSKKLQKALAEDSIVLHFQPIINVSTREVVGHEALVRLIVDENIIYPDRFIPFLEQAEQMSILDRHVIGKAFFHLHEYPQLGHLAINLSAQAFTDDRLIEFIQSKLDKYQIDPSRIVFELTESASLSNITGTKRIVTRLNDIGCNFSIDDFGTGFSTFSYLKEIPAESVKIDGSFVKDMIDDQIDHALVKAIHEIAKELGKTTVAEFVENEEILNELDKLGVNFAQGYHIGRPEDIGNLFPKVEKKVQNF